MATRSLVSAMRDWSSWKENISLNTGLRVLDLYAVFFCPSSFLQVKEIQCVYLIRPIGAFQDQLKQTMINKYSNEHNHVKNPNWQEADQLAIYKRSREVELGATENNIR